MTLTIVAIAVFAAHVAVWLSLPASSGSTDGRPETENAELERRLA